MTRFCPLNTLLAVRSRKRRRPRPVEEQHGPARVGNAVHRRRDIGDSARTRGGGVASGRGAGALGGGPLGHREAVAQRGGGAAHQALDFRRAAAHAVLSGLLGHVRGRPRRVHEVERQLSGGRLDQVREVPAPIHEQWRSLALRPVHRGLLP